MLPELASPCHVSAQEVRELVLFSGHFGMMTTCPPRSSLLSYI